MQEKFRTFAALIPDAITVIEIIDKIIILEIYVHTKY